MEEYKDLAEAGPDLDAAALNLQNKQAAFKGETTASAKYAAYSKKANEEGNLEIALLFKAAAVAEKIHTNNHKIIIERAGQETPEATPGFTVKTTKELEDATAGEPYEFFARYPEFIKKCKQGRKLYGANRPEVCRQSGRKTQGSLLKSTAGFGK